MWVCVCMCVPALQCLSVSAANNRDSPADHLTVCSIFDTPPAVFTCSHVWFLSFFLGSFSFLMLLETPLHTHNAFIWAEQFLLAPPSPVPSCLLVLRWVLLDCWREPDQEELDIDTLKYTNCLYSSSFLNNNGFMGDYSNHPGIFLIFSWIKILHCVKYQWESKLIMHILRNNWNWCFFNVDGTKNRSFFFFFFFFVRHVKERLGIHPCIPCPCRHVDGGALQQSLRSERTGGRVESRQCVGLPVQVV